MRSLVAALLYIAGTTVGWRFSGDLRVGVLVVFFLTSALLGWARAVLCRRSVGAWGWVALIALAMLRGYAAGSEPPQSVSRADTSGSTLLVELEVRGASEAGPRCRIPVRALDGGTGWIIAEPEDCRFWRGDRIVVPAASRQRVDAREVVADPVRRALGPAQPSTESWAPEVLWLRSRGTSSYWRWVAELRAYAWRVTRGNSARSFLAAAVLGQRRALDRHDRLQLRRAGLGHLVAVSGIHVGLVAALVYAGALRLACLLSWPPRSLLWLTLLPLGAYVGATGASASASRASLFFLVLLAGRWLGRPVHALTAVLVVAAGMLALVPAMVGDLSFQLSTAAMILIATGRGLSLWAMNLRLALGLAVLSVWHFGAAPLHGAVLNLVAVPLFSIWVLPLALVGWLGRLEWMLDLAAWGATALLDLARWGASVPSLGADTLAIGGALLLILSLVARRWTLRFLGCGPAIASALCALSLAGTGASGESVAARGTRWWVSGTPRASTQLWISARSPETLCVGGRVSSPMPWPRLVSATGTKRVQGLDGTLEVGTSGSFSCTPLDENCVRAWQEECRRWRGGASGPVFVRSHPSEGGRAQCDVWGRWVALASKCPTLLLHSVGHDG